MVQHLLVCYTAVERIVSILSRLEHTIVFEAGVFRLDVKAIRFGRGLGGTHYQSGRIVGLAIHVRVPRHLRFVGKHHVTSLTPKAQLVPDHSRSFHEVNRVYHLSTLPALGRECLLNISQRLDRRRYFQSNASILLWVAAVRLTGMVAGDYHSHPPAHR